VILQYILGKNKKLIFLDRNTRMFYWESPENIKYPSRSMEESLGNCQPKNSTKCYEHEQNIIISANKI